MWLVGVLFCLALAGCGSKELDEERKVLIFSSNSDVTSIDPQIASGLSEPIILCAIFEGLVVPDSVTYQPRPGVADRWSISENGKIYEFHLRDSAKWSNGDAITAEDFVFSVKRALSSKLNCPSVKLFFPLRNAEKFYKKQVRDFNEVGIRAIDKHTLRIELEQPLNSFMHIIMQPCWYPLNEAVCETIGRYNDWNDFFASIISNGPFMVIDKKTNRSVILEKNPYYWDYEAVKLDGVRFIVGANIIQNLNMFRNGNIDICTYNPQSAYFSPDLIDEDDVKTEVHFGCFYLLLNTKNKPLDDKNVRMALSMALRRNVLLNLLSMTNEPAAYGLIPTLGPDYVATKMFEEDHIHARELLAAAGYGDGKNFPKMRILCNGSKRQNTVCTFLKNELKNVLDIDVDIDYVRQDEFLFMRREGNFDICCGDWFGDYPDPEKFLKVFSRKNQQNYCRWHSIEYDELLNAAANMHNEKERLRLLKDAECLLMRNMPVIPLYFESELYLMKKRVSGWDAGLLDIHQWKSVDVEGE
jgi:oligopeptide transport system substrate-binding protein